MSLIAQMKCQPYSLTDVDTLFEQACANGAMIRMSVMDAFWGERYEQLIIHLTIFGKSLLIRRIRQSLKLTRRQKQNVLKWQPKNLVNLMTSQSDRLVRFLLKMTGLI